MDEKEIKYDIEGFEIVTDAIMTLLNDYPDMDERITFNSLASEEGTTMYPVSGAVIVSEKKDIIGNIKQQCNYPFMLIFRAGGLNESNRMKAKERLDSIGKWLEMQSVTIEDSVHKLKEYPKLTEGREFTQIKRTTPAYLYDQKDNRVEEWAIGIAAEYKYTYRK